MEKDLFIVSREELRRAAALAEMTQTMFFKGWITPASLTFIEQGTLEWSERHVTGLLNRLRECSPAMKRNQTYCRLLCEQRWDELDTVAVWEHSFKITEVGLKNPRYMKLSKLESYRRTRPEMYEEYLPYAMKDAREYLTLNIDLIIENLTDYQKKFKSEENHKN
jgi:hypothetical protein